MIGTWLQLTKIVSPVSVSLLRVTLSRMTFIEWTLFESICGRSTRYVRPL
jgi:hypothetical protein